MWQPGMQDTKPVLANCNGFYSTLLQKLCWLCSVCFSRSQNGALSAVLCTGHLSRRSYLPRLYSWRGHMPATGTQCGKKRGGSWWAYVQLPAVQGGVFCPGTLQLLSEGAQLSVQGLFLGLGCMLCPCQLQPQPLSLLQTQSCRLDHKLSCLACFTV